MSPNQRCSKGYNIWVMLEKNFCKSDAVPVVHPTPIQDSILQVKTHTFKTKTQTLKTFDDDDTCFTAIL